MPPAEESGPKKTRDSSPEASCDASGARNCPGTVNPPSAIPDISKEEDFRRILVALSTDRLASYRTHPAESAEAAFSRHQWNIEVSECFYAPLAVLEVVLRNQFDRAIAAHTGNPDWLLTIPTWLDIERREDVQAAQEYLIGRGQSLTQARMVQEMSFGFWTSLFNVRYETTLFRQTAARLFPGLERSRRVRTIVSPRFESIRKLRNRVFHFRRIWNRPSLTEDYDRIVEALEWLDGHATRLLMPPECRERLLRVLSRKP